MFGTSRSLRALAITVIAWSAMSVAACAQTAPVASAPLAGTPIACDPLPDEATTLACMPAVQTAAAALPADHAPIFRIEFHYGINCPPNARCRVDPQQGYVVFVTNPAGEGQGLWVPLTADANGLVVLTDAVTVYPPW